MTSIKIQYIKLAIFGSAAALLLSWGLESDKEIDLTPTIQASFEKIYYAEYALNFPHTESALHSCRGNKNKLCLEVYEQFQNAKSTLLSLPPDKSLSVTLDIIEKSCLSSDPTMANNICHGGLMSLFFYDTPEQDIEIFQQIHEYPQTLKNIIFNNDFLWFYNRPRKSDWINYISTLNIDWEQDGQKQFILNMLKSDTNQVDTELWAFKKSKKEKKKDEGNEKKHNK